MDLRSEQGEHLIRQNLIGKCHFKLFSLSQSMLKDNSNYVKKEFLFYKVFKLDNLQYFVLQENIGQEKDRVEGFEVGNTINACTKGLWIWPELIYIDKKPILVIDTEGIGSLEEHQNHDVKIFLMAMLLSSYFIYNSLGNIDDMALQNLGLIVNLTKMLQKADPNAQKELFQSFPSFLWVLRDFSLRLEDSYGNKITAKEYLENGLKPLKGISEAIENKNKVRRHITQFFQERDCVTLVRPSDDEKILQNLNNISMNDLDNDFREQMSNLRQKLQFKIQFKCYKGKPVTPFTFIEMAKYFVDAINQGVLPVIESQWQMIQNMEFESNVTKCLQNYQNMAQTQLSGLNKEEIEQFIQLSIKQVKSLLQDMTDELVFKAKWKDVKKKLHTINEEIWSNLQDEMSQKYEELREFYLEEIRNYESDNFWGIVDIGNEAIQEFQKAGIQEQQFTQFVLQIWESIIQRIQMEFRIIKNLSNIHIELEQKFQLDIRLLNEQIQQITQQQSEDIRQKDKMIEKLTIELKNTTQINQYLQSQFDEYKQISLDKMDESSAQIQNLKKKHQKDLDLFREQLKKLQDRMIETNIEIDKINRLIDQKDDLFKSENISLQKEICSLKDQLDEKEQQLKQKQEDFQINYYSGKKTRVNEDIFMITAHRESENSLEEWKLQKEFLKKQLQEAQLQLKDHRKINEELITNLKL
ncbi:hypothetical protein pb186bvf_000723 [Paramecium bursaria]